SPPADRSATPRSPHKRWPISSPQPANWRPSSTRRGAAARNPRLRGLCRERLEVLRERQSGARLDRYRRRFDTCLCRILGSDQELSVVAAAPSRLARCSRLARTGQNWPSFASSSGARVGAVCRKALARQEFERALVACVWRRGGLV